MSEPSLFELLGGKDSIKAMVDVLQKKVLADPNLAPFFKNTDEEYLNKRLRKFFIFATNGTQEYHGKSIADAHMGRGIGDAHFDLFCGHIIESMKQLGVNDEAMLEQAS